MADSTHAAAGRGVSRPLSVVDTMLKLFQTSVSGKNGSRSRAWLAGLPFIALAILASHVMDTRPAVPFARVLIGGGQVVWSGGKYRVPILNGFYGAHSLDEVLTLANMFFMPAVYGFDPSSRAQAVSFLADGGVVLAVWWLESMRKGDKPWYLQHPSFVALWGQLVGLGVMCPQFCFLALMHQPASSFDQDPSRGSPIYPAPLGPALLLGYYLPACGMLFWPHLAERQAWLFLWQLYPVHVSVARHLLSLVGAGKRKRGGKGKEKSVTRTRSVADQLGRDLLFTRVCMGFAVLLAVIAWQWTLWTTGFAIADVFLPRPAAAAATLPDLTRFCAQFLRWDEALVLGPMLLWLAYVYADAKRERLINVSWPSMLGLGTLLTALVGPGATLAIGWMYREEALAARREKAALRLEVVAKVESLLKANGA